MKAAVSIGSDGFAKNNSGHVETARQKSPTGVNLKLVTWPKLAREVPFTHTHAGTTRSKVKLAYDFRGKYAKTC